MISIKKEEEGEEMEIKSELTSNEASFEEKHSDSIISNQSLKYLELIRDKLKFYHHECNRYSTQRIKIIEKCIENEQELCNLDEYMIGTLQCEVMFESFEKYPLSPLTTISLKNNHLDYRCCEAMASFIESSFKLRNLNLDGCKIGNEGMKLLQHAFSVSPSIISLNLANNNITDEGGEMLASFLMRNEVCEELNLSRNSLGFLAANALGKVLLENHTLQKLDLCHNRLYENFGIVQLLEGLRLNKSLEYLDVSWNALYGKPLGDILSRSIKGAKLKVFKIENNSLASYELQKLALGMKFSKTIEEVYVGGNFPVTAAEEDELLVQVFGTKSPLQLLSFGSSYHLSHEAFEALKVLRQLKPTIRVIYQNIILPKPPNDVSMLDICADRAKLLALKPKQRRLQRDMGVFMLKLKSHPTSYMLRAEFLEALAVFKASLDSDVVNSYIEACLVDIDGKKQINVHFMANHYLQRHPANS